MHDTLQLLLHQCISCVEYALSQHVMLLEIAFFLYITQ